MSETTLSAVPDLPILTNIAAGLFISAVYVVVGIRIWQRRNRRWSLLGVAATLVYAWPTAHYIWDALGGRVEAEPPNYLGLAMLILPALLVLQMVRWSLQDEARTKEVIDQIGEE